MAISTPGTADRIDERTHYRVLVLIDGSVTEGDFVLSRAVGDLAYAPNPFVVNTKNQAAYPMSAVLKLQP